MSDGDLLLRAILECPSDRTLRLVYADWLEEHADAEWAAFIRASLMDRDEPEGCKSLSRRFRKKWLAEAGLTRAFGGCWGGMLDNLHMRQSTFLLPEVLRLFSKHPIRHVRLTDKAPEYIWGRNESHRFYESHAGSAWGMPVLEAPIFDKLVGDVEWREVGTSTGTTVNVKSKVVGKGHKATMNALSLACVNWGRQQTGLGRLEG